MKEKRKINGRNIADTKGIPAENIVVSEMAVKRGERIRNLVSLDVTDGK